MSYLIVFSGHFGAGSVYVSAYSFIAGRRDTAGVYNARWSRVWRLVCVSRCVYMYVVLSDAARTVVVDTHARAQQTNEVCVRVCSACFGERQFARHFHVEI